MKFTTSSIKALNIPPKGKPYYKIFQDDELKGFAIRVTDTGAKTFIINKKINNKLVRVTLGRVGEITLKDARAKFTLLLRDYIMGNEPVKKAKAQQQHKQLTLKKVSDDYLSIRNLKPATQNEYRSVVKEKFSHWLNKPLASITKDMVMKCYAEIGKSSQSAATKAFKILSALFNFAIANYENEHGDCVITENPVLRLSQIRAWYPKKRRQTRIDNHDLPKWFKEVNRLHNNKVSSTAESVKYYLLLLLFTGLRREEAMPLIWSEFKSKNKTIAQHQRTLDLKKCLVHIPDPKNQQENTLPLPTYLCERLAEFKAKTGSHYVFPNAGESNHIIEPRKSMKLITQRSGVAFTLHDIRRTFATIAESLDISAFALKRLLNHKTIHSDVTAGYIVNDVERLRAPIERIADHILTLVGKESS